MSKELNAEATSILKGHLYRSGDIHALLDAWSAICENCGVEGELEGVLEDTAILILKQLRGVLHDVIDPELLEGIWLDPSNPVSYETLYSLLWSNTRRLLGERTKSNSMGVQMWENAANDPEDHRADVQ